MNKEYIYTLEDITKVKKNGYKVFSCFACGGGSSMGYKLAGFDVIGINEIDPEINKVYLANNKVKYNFLMGIKDFYNLKDIPEELYNLDILDGSPPCSTFSMAGQREKNWGKEKKFREGQAVQVLDDLFFDFLDVAERLKPKIIIAENVKGIISGNARGYINLILKRLRLLGYENQIFLLNAATMGVPQKRERVFIISRRSELNLPNLKLSFNETPITYGEFADNNYKPLNKDTTTYQRWLKRIPKDKSIGDIVARTENKVSGFTQMLLKKTDIPPTTIASSGSMIILYDKFGRLSDRDIKIIQSFPIDYNPLKIEMKYIAGMSVPPLMIKKIAEQIYLQWLKKNSLYK